MPVLVRRFCNDMSDTENVTCFRGLLAAAKSLGHEDTFYWIASDGWGKQQQVRTPHYNYYSDIYIVNAPVI